MGISCFNLEQTIASNIVRDPKEGNVAWQVQQKCERKYPPIADYLLQDTANDIQQNLNLNFAFYG